MKPYLEKLRTDVGASWAMLNRRLEEGIPFQWHHHPEMELTMTLNSRGQRFIGDHAGSYDHGDLVLVGANLPHSWYSTDRLDPNEPHIALVLWFGQDWLEDLADSAVELRPLRDLVIRSRTGLKFSTELADELRPQYEALIDQPPEARLLGLLQVLLRLAHDDGAIALSSVHETAAGPRDRIDRVLDHIHSNYSEEVRLETLAEIAALSVSGLHRLFRKHTQSTVSDYLIRLRIADACARLSGTSQPIQHIAVEVGYGALANFNRHFRRLRGMTPREYRKHFSRRL
ncbi:transcriptional regulator [Devosia riboflavina]|uniref:Transcriptional regulator n=1 Tax=Devosia riboflavina TaxID=46914 RepID=A0A087M713_9HYPH|nr:AraC family transcriptional regulator [Devosia riboflavina]KFL32666.1 transcriptional regulator [Devosia riboflavina]